MSFTSPRRSLPKKFTVYKDMTEYDSVGQVGEGTYGQVFKAKHKSSLRFVALKKLYLKEDDKGKEKNRDGFPITGIREIEILRSLKHPNIVELQAMVSISSQGKMDMYMVFEYMDHDLTGILTNNAVNYSLPQIKCLAKQLFQGLEYLHSLQIIHRDIKGANLLLNNQGYLKIADFGLARRIHIDRDSGAPMADFEYTNRVVTLWYRSPELLLGSTSYGFEVDIWSTGFFVLI
jgi:serine/threonine protein kinase